MVMVFEDGVEVLMGLGVVNEEGLSTSGGKGFRFELAATPDFRAWQNNSAQRDLEIINLRHNGPLMATMGL